MTENTNQSQLRIGVVSMGPVYLPNTVWVAGALPTSTYCKSLIPENFVPESPLEYVAAACTEIFISCDENVRDDDHNDLRSFLDGQSRTKLETLIEQLKSNTEH